MNGEEAILSIAMSATVTAVVNKGEVVKALKNLKRVCHDRKAKKTNAAR